MLNILASYDMSKELQIHLDPEMYCKKYMC